VLLSAFGPFGMVVLGEGFTIGEEKKAFFSRSVLFIIVNALMFFVFVFLNSYL